MKDLKDKLVTEIWVSPCLAYLLFVTNEGLYVWAVEGDCCSHGWFADILGVENLLHRRVTAVDAIALPAPSPEMSAAELRAFDPDNKRTTQDEDCLYGYELKTPRGVTTIVFRCSSNGYYGAFLHQVTVGLSPARLAEFRQITEDWSA